MSMVAVPVKAQATAYIVSVCKVMREGENKKHVNTISEESRELVRLVG